MLDLLGVLHGHLVLGGVYVSDFELFFICCWCSATSHVQLFVTPWTAARQASLSLTISQSLLKLGNSTVKEFSYNAGDPDLIPGLGRSPEKAIHSSILGLSWWLRW